MFGLLAVEYARVGDRKAERAEFQPVVNAVMAKDCK